MSDERHEKYTTFSIYPRSRSVYRTGSILQIYYLKGFADNKRERDSEIIENQIEYLKTIKDISWFSGYVTFLQSIFFI